MIQQKSQRMHSEGLTLFCLYNYKLRLPMSQFVSKYLLYQGSVCLSCNCSARVSFIAIHIIHLIYRVINGQSLFNVVPCFIDRLCVFAQAKKQINFNLVVWGHTIS